METISPELKGVLKRLRSAACSTPSPSTPLLARQQKIPHQDFRSWRSRAKPTAARARPAS
ncbi:MAG: hypothetical protein IPP07_21020 [Holophagales bacterium]|nr:hypothetical protein [Holophagales bacterium]